MPKRIPSTIQIAAHLAEDYIEGNLLGGREFPEEEEAGEGNIFETLQSGLSDRTDELKYADAADEEQAEKNKRLKDILSDMQDALDRAVSSSQKLARTANTTTSRIFIKDSQGNVTEHVSGNNHGEFEAAERDLKETAAELKDFRRGLDQLQREFPEEMEQPYMQQFMGKFTAEQLENGNKVLKNCGQTKSALEWIEDSKKKLHSKDFLDELDAGMHIARIIAARQLSGAEGKNTDTLETTMLTEGELDARAYELLETPAFSTYLQSIGVSEVPVYGEDESRQEFAVEHLSDDKPYLKLFGSRTRGGALEADLKKYLNKRPDAEELPEEIFGSYIEKTEEAYLSYRDYINSNSMPDDFIVIDMEQNIVKERPFTMHDAARMAAAYQLSIEEEKSPFKRGTFKEKRLENLAKKIEKTPEFRLALRDPNLVTRLKYGNCREFYDGFSEYQKKFRPIRDEVQISAEGENGAVKEGHVKSAELTHEAMKSLYRKLLGPSEDSREQQKYVESGSKKYQAMVKAVKAFVEKQPEDITEEDRLKVFAATVHYQEGREKKRFWQSGQDRFDLSLQIGKAAVAGTFAENEFKKQIDYINELRGEPGFLQSDTRIQPESVKDAFAEAKKQAADRIEENAPEAAEEITL